MTSKSTALRGKHLGAQRGSEVVSVLGAGEAVVTVMNSPEKEREREREMRGERGLERVREVCNYNCCVLATITFVLTTTCGFDFYYTQRVLSLPSFVCR